MRIIENNNAHYEGVIMRIMEADNAHFRGHIMRIIQNCLFAAEAKPVGGSYDEGETWLRYRGNIVIPM